MPIPPNCFCSFYQIKTQKSSHFATFPPKLIEPCILAGSPEKTCAACGIPWERIIEKTKSFQSGSGKSGNLIQGKQDLSAKETNSTPDIRKGPCVSSKTIGYRQFCSCDSGTRPGVVLDPFLGSGTTGLVCEKLNRRWIGIELSEAYCKMAAKRIDNATKQRRL
ncbi:site-specific DNA-methyltransferase, partial [bacterium]|nr:site-specific DNA-methyltransferase [bacterium]